MPTDDKTYDLYGALPAAWLITMRIDQQGIARAQVKEKREAPDAATLQDWSRLTNAPRPDGMVLPCTGISMEWQREDGFWKLAWDYEGFNGDPESVTFGDPSITTYELDCGVTTAPIETHPRFLDIAKEYGVTNQHFDKQGGFLGFPKTLPTKAGGTGSDKNPLYGVEDFKVSTLVWRVTSATPSLPVDFKRNLGLIDTPRTLNGPTPPQLEGRANWLKTVARATWRGNLWTTQEEYEASGPGGWNPQVYRSRG